MQLIICIQVQSYHTEMVFVFFYTEKAYQGEFFSPSS